MCSISKPAEVGTETPTGAPAKVEYDISAIHDPQLDSIPYASSPNPTPPDASMATDEHGVPSEFLALQQVRESTTIPVPRVYHVLPMGSHTWISMNHISGESLFELWPRMSENSKTRVAKTLHNYMLQLRTLRHDVPGPPSPGREARVWKESSLFEVVVDTRGPFPSYRALSDFFNNVRK
ncbi:hypothetical protein DXG01_006842 [Tephrocybe rancida]|nr:hypothetical protein DXG01_006842 [Tephrocybe rancida]